jgi:hypothetical protein
VPAAVRELLAAQGIEGDVQIVEGPRVSTYIPDNMKHWKDDVRTLDGKVV